MKIFNPAGSRQSKKGRRERLVDFSIKHPYIFSFALIVLEISTFSNNNWVIAVINGLMTLTCIILVFALNKTKDSSDVFYSLTIILAPLFLIITYIMTLIGKFLIPVIFQIGSIESWIGFAGSILGGTITMIAVSYTISSESRLKRKEIALTSMPNLLIGLSGSYALGISSTTLNGEQVQDDFYSIHIEPTIENISAYPAQNLKFTRAEVMIHESFLYGLDKKTKPVSLISKLDQFNADKIVNIFIQKENKISFPIMFDYPIPKDKNDDVNMVLIEIDFEYQDMMQCFTHKKKCKIEFTPGFPKPDRKSKKKVHPIIIIPEITNTPLKNEELADAFKTH